MFKPKLSSLYLMGAVLCVVVQTMTFRYDPKEVFLVNQVLNLFKVLFFLAFYMTLAARPGTRFFRATVWGVLVLTAVQYVSYQLIGQQFQVVQILGSPVLQLPSTVLGVAVVAMGAALVVQKTVDGRKIQVAAVLVILHGLFLATYFLVVGAYLTGGLQNLGIKVTGEAMSVFSSVTQWLYFVGLFVITAPVKEKTGLPGSRAQRKG